MDKRYLEQRYRDELRPRYETYASKLHTLISELVSSANIPIAQIECRVKTVNSFLAKVERKDYSDPFSEMKDICGIRLITYYQDDVDKIAEIIENEFNVDKNHSIDKSVQLNVDEFGYRSFHLVVLLKDHRLALPEWAMFAALPVEIQIRTVLQHAWAFISHKLDYKTTSQAPSELRRQLFCLSALLELADNEFLSLRDKSASIAARYNEEMTKGEFDIPIDLNSLTGYLNKYVDLKTWEIIGLAAGMMPIKVTEPREQGMPLQRLLETLQMLQIKQIAEFATALSEIRPSAGTILSDFVKKVHAYHHGIYANPIDIINILICIQFAHEIPSNFDCGAGFHSLVKRALREVCRLPLYTMILRKKNGPEIRR